MSKSSKRKLRKAAKRLLDQKQRTEVSRKERRERETRRENKTTKSGWKRSLPPFLQRSWKVIVFVVGVVGIYRAYIFYSPRLDLVPLADPQSGNPFTAKFEFTNRGALDLNALMPFCYINEATYSGGQRIRGSLTYARAFFVPKLKRGETMTIPAVEFVQVPAFNLTKADITLVVVCKQSILPFKVKKYFGLVADKTTEGKFRWLPQPVMNRNIKLPE